MSFERFFNVLYDISHLQCSAASEAFRCGTSADSNVPHFQQRLIRSHTSFTVLLLLFFVFSDPIRNSILGRTQLCTHTKLLKTFLPVLNLPRPLVASRRSISCFQGQRKRNLSVSCVYGFSGFSFCEKNVWHRTIEFYDSGPHKMLLEMYRPVDFVPPSF